MVSTIYPYGLFESFMSQMRVEVDPVIQKILDIDKKILFLKEKLSEPKKIFVSKFKHNELISGYENQIESLEEDRWARKRELDDHLLIALVDNRVLFKDKDAYASFDWDESQEFMQIIEKEFERSEIHKEIYKNVLKCFFDLVKTDETLSVVLIEDVFRYIKNKEIRELGKSFSQHLSPENRRKIQEFSYHVDYFNGR